MAPQTLHIDIAIIGGGVAGLWALNQLRNRGFSAVLFEQEALGGYQTMASQGMIHGGIKYALGGRLLSVVGWQPAVTHEFFSGQQDVARAG
jgi:glycerol-3-phosphate dehydrogenase